MTHDAATTTAPFDGGAMLLDLHRRLVLIHYDLATHALPDPELRRHATVEIEEALRLIADDPTYRAAREAAEPARRARIAERRAKAAPAT